MDHIDRLYHGDRESALLQTTLADADTALEKNMFPCNFYLLMSVYYYFIFWVTILLYTLW
jgi:hypothetical protein